MLPRPQHPQPRGRCPSTRCGILARRSLIAFGFLQVIWMLIVFQDSVMTANEPDRLIDGGMRRDSSTALGSCGDAPNTCRGVKTSNHSEKVLGERNISKGTTDPVTPRGIIARQASLGVSSSPRTLEAEAPWCSGRGPHPNTTDRKYFLTAVLLVRIYASDPAELTTREMMQWLQYLNYAGVRHVYVYDAYFHANESQRDELGCFVERGYVTYVDWSRQARPRYTIAGTQVAAYQHCLDRYGDEFAWQTAIDIDEYPYCHGDHEAGFLARAVRKIASTRPNVGEISMQNYLYLGKPLNHSVHPILIDRLWRRTYRAANNLVKPIYRPKGIAAANVHHNALRGGYFNFSPKAKLLRMSHFWGARLQNWGEDTPRILNMTVEDKGMERAVTALQQCLNGCEMGCC